LTGFFVTDSWKSRVDDNSSNNAGLRGGLNFGYALCHAFDVQLGASFAGYDFHGRDGATVGPTTDEPSSVEDHVMLTAGISVVYDQLIADNVGEANDRLSLGQLRARIGLLCDPCNEFGVWGTASVQRQFLRNANRDVRALDQLNIYWNHLWCTGAHTMCWIGIAEEPGEMTFGMSGEAPLSDCLALYANAHYILPSTSGAQPDAVNAFSEESWNVSFGLTYYFGGGACRNSLLGARPLPLLPVADNGSFALRIPSGNF